MSHTRVIFVGAFVTANNDLVWGELELKSGEGYRWLDMGIENAQNIYVAHFIDEKVKRHLLGDAGGDVLVVGDTLTFKLSNDRRLCFVPPHYNIAIWLAAWKFSRSHHFRGISRNMAVVGEEMKRWQVRDMDGKIYNVRLHNLMCDCKGKIFSPRSAASGGIFLCDHILAVLARLPKSILFSHMDELQKIGLGEVVCSLVDGEEDEGDDAQPNGNGDSVCVAETGGNSRIVVHFCKDDGDVLLSLFVEKVDGDMMTVKFQWGTESTAPFRVRDGVVGNAITRVVSMLLAGKDIEECHKDVVAYIASQE